MSGDIDLYGDWGAWEDREATREVDPMNAATLLFGNVPVPYTASWTSEESVFLARCPYADAIALCQPSSPGEGKPLFGKPHMCRQREVIALGLCDLCGKPLKNRTKVSLSHARSRANGASPFDVLQVEPLLHKECALLSARHCPSLRRDLRNGTVEVRQVTSWAVQFAIYSEQGTFEACGVRQKSISHAKVQLRAWKDRSPQWLGMTDD